MRLGDWINRKRHNRGFGIQSPSAFFFITQVLRERLPYYHYPLLDAIANEENGISRKHARELFRITNDYNPERIIAAGSHTAACAMALAKPAAVKHSISGTAPGKKACRLLAELGCDIARGDTAELLSKILEESGKTGMLYIGSCDNYAELWDIAMRHVNEESVVVIEGIHRNKALEQWWQGVVDNPATIITYDLYSYGIVLFNKNRYKQNYKLKL